MQRESPSFFYFFLGPPCLVSHSEKVKLKRIREAHCRGFYSHLTEMMCRFGK